MQTNASHGKDLKSETRLISVVVPIFFEEEVLGESYARLKKVLTSLPPKYDHEILFVNDGSADRSLELMLAISKDDSHVRIIDLSRNFGHQFAITAGMDLAAGDAVVVIDADLQDPPEVIPRMVAKWEEGFKVVYGVRTMRQGESRFKRATASLFYRLLQSLSGTKLPVDAGDFRLIDRSVVNVMKNMREEHRYVRGLMAWAGFSQCGVEYERDRRYAGETKYSLTKMFRLALDGIVSFSAKPLYLAGYLGLLVTFLSMLQVVWILVGKLLHPESSVLGWTSLMAAILFLGGIQLICIGILGQYLGRVFEQCKHRPLYVVAQTFGFESPHDVHDGRRPDDEGCPQKDDPYMYLDGCCWSSPEFSPAR
jgi:dolichol-phosphate mannosyltransferase